MTARRADAIVVGLGAMGSAVADALAARGADVIGIDRFVPPHNMGSTHGRSRVIREAYFEHPLYVPLLRRAYAGWDGLERDGGARLFHRTGGAMIGPPDGELFAGSLRSAREHGIDHDVLDAAAARKRLPAFVVSSGWKALLEHRAGVLFPERCVEAMLARARARGARLRTGERVLQWEGAGDGVRCTTERGEFLARRLVLCAGPWIGELMGDAEAARVFDVERQVQHWFTPRTPALFEPDRCPVALWEHEPGKFLYALPDFGDGVKVAVHHEGERTSPDRLDRQVSDSEVRDIRTLIDRCLPEAAGRPAGAAVCLYTNTPDRHFVIDSHPAWPQVIVVSPCSGHGFKFAPIVGELGAQLALGESPDFDLSPFRLDRFGAADERTVKQWDAFH